MDGQRFDQFARAFSNGASRRQLLKGLIGGAIAATAARFEMQRARAQCTWSGTFDAPFGGGISMTLHEAGGQVSGSYTFSQDNAVRNGVITGIVRAEYQGYTVLDGYWREPGEGGRLWFVMLLDDCAGFTGSYTSTDVAEDWTPGWDGIRTGGDGSASDVEVVYFTNPADSALATITEDGQSFTFLGSRDAEGLVARINHVEGDAPDGDPQQRVFLDFADDGKLIRGALASGEMMLFEWESDARVMVTVVSADGLEAVQIPFDAEAAAAYGTAAHAPRSEKQARGDGDATLLAYSAHPDMMGTLAGSGAARQSAPVDLKGIIKVQCDNRAPYPDAYVKGSYWKTGTPRMGPESEFAFQPLSFDWAAPGVFTYKLPLAPAPAWAPSGKSTAALWTAWEVICIGSTSPEFSYLFGSTAICTAVSAIPRIGKLTGPACALFMLFYKRICKATSVGLPGASLKAYVDSYDQGYEVTAYALPIPGFDERITVTVTPTNVPTGVIYVGPKEFCPQQRGEIPVGCPAGTVRGLTHCEPGCSSDADCQAGEICEVAEGHCVPGTRPASCASNADCGPCGMCDLAGHCITVACTGYPDCPCPEGQICLFFACEPA